MRRLWGEGGLRVMRGGEELAGTQRDRWLQRWREGRAGKGLVVMAQAAPAWVHLVDPRQVLWPDASASSWRLPDEVPEGFDLVQVEVRESVAQDLRRRAAEKGMPVADLLARLVALLDVEAIGKRASGI